MSLAAGDRLGDWVVERPLGAGGMGSVYRCHSVLADDVLAAVKVLKESDLGDFERRFVLELRTLSALAHPAIVQVKGGGRDEARGLVYMAMELVDGEDLSAVLARGALTVDDALRIFLPVAEALRYAHDKGVAHRDIKPANIMLRNDGTPVIVDFGIAVAHDHTRLTREGMVPGTVTYLPPEVFQGEAPTPHATDAYALGVVMWEAITGDFAFAAAPDSSESESLVQVMGKKLRADALDPGEAAPEPLREVIRRTTDPEPDTRLVDLGEVRRLLGAATGEQALPPAAPRPRRGRALRWVGALAALGVIGALALALVAAILVAAGAVWYGTSTAAPPAPTVDLAAALEEGVFALEHGDLEAAHTHAGAALDGHPEDPYANLLYGQVLAVAGEVELARSYLCAAADGGLRAEVPAEVDCARGPGAATPLAPSLAVARVDLGEALAPAVAAVEEEAMFDEAPAAMAPAPPPPPASAPAPRARPEPARTSEPAPTTRPAPAPAPAPAATGAAPGGSADDMAGAGAAPRKSRTRGGAMAKPAPEPAAAVRQVGEPAVEGALSAADVARVLDGRIGSLTPAYQRALASQPDLAGALRLEVHIAASGRVSEVQVLSSTLDHPELEAWITQTASRWAFPAADADTVVTWRLSFEAG